MGTELEQGQTEFRIKAGNKAPALAAVKALAARLDATGASSDRKRHFSWVITEHFTRAATLEDALVAWRWGPETDDAGDIVGLEFTGEKLGDEETLFSALAPYVVNGSCIEAVAAMEPLRWRFENGVCHTDDGHVEYDAGPSSRQALENIHGLLYADGPDTQWDAETLSAIAEVVAKVIPPPAASQ